MSFVTLASGDNFIVGDISSLAQLAWNVSIGSVSPSELEQFVNPAAYQAELGQPEGAEIELNISGWTIFGTDYSSTVANHINSYWQQGEFTVNGENMQAWSGASAIAYGGNNTVTLQYIKGQIWVLYIALAIALAYVALRIFSYYTGQKWSVVSDVQAVTGNPSGNWWQRMNIFEKGGVVLLSGVVIYVGFTFWEKLTIAKAGATKSSVNIYEK